MMLERNRQDILLQISRDARRFVQALGPAPTAASGSQPKLYPHHHLSIPLPPPITPLFLARGFDSTAAEKFNQAYLDKALSLKQVYEDKHRQVLKTCLAGGSFVVQDMDLFISATHVTYIHRYNEAMQEWQSKMYELSQRRLSFVQVAGGKGNERRPTFKIESIPLLEQAFSVNAYPNRADKEGLAEQTGMEYKQVNIWFQNRRARSKKEGLTLQRTATFVDPLRVERYHTASPDSDFLVSCGAENATRSPEVAIPSDLPKDPFALGSRPVHTFPTPFPPLYDEDPFPVRSGTGSFQMPWLRKCVINPIQKPLADIEQLTARMASLSLSSDASGGDAPLPSFTFILPRAPLPALIRTATASSRAQPLATLVTAAGSSLASKSTESRNLYRTLPARLPRFSIERQSGPLSLSSITSSRPIQISYSRASARPRRSETRSPSPPQSRSSSLSSVTSSRSTSSSSSGASSVGPLTPVSTSARIEALAFAKDTSPAPHSHCMRRSSITAEGRILS